MFTLIQSGAIMSIRHVLLETATRLALVIASLLLTSMPHDINIMLACFMQFQSASILAFVFTVTFFADPTFHHAL